MLDYERREYGKLVREAFKFIETPLIEGDLPELEKCVRFVHVWLGKRVGEREWKALSRADMEYIWTRELNAFRRRLGR